MCLAKLYLKPNHNLLIVWFTKKMTVVVTLPEFKSWHVKHQNACPWLTHARVTTLQLVLALLGNISSSFGQFEFIKVGKSFPCDNNAKLMCLMNETI